jgi:hypothetical protein
VLFVTVVCGVGLCVLVVCVLRAPVVLLEALSAKLHQKFGKPRHIGDRRKARDETSQTITFD